MPTQGRFQGCGFVLAVLGSLFAVALVLSLLAARLTRSSSGDSLAASSPARPTGSYTVQPGDTLSGIADRHGTTVAALMGANGLADADQIEVGQRLSLAGGKARRRTKPSATPAPPTSPTPKRSSRPEVDHPEIHRSGSDRCRYYFVSLSELGEERLSVLTRQDCPTYGTNYERIELNCRTAEFRYIGDAARAEDIVSRPSKWLDFLAESAKEDTAKFVCARAGRTLGDRRSPEPEPLDVPNDAELHALFMDCSALVSALMRPVAQNRCYDIGAYLHGRYIQEERWGDATRISDRMKTVGWWGWVGPRYRPVR